MRRILFGKWFSGLSFGVNKMKKLTGVNVSVVLPVEKSDVSPPQILHTVHDFFSRRNGSWELIIVESGCEERHWYEVEEWAKNHSDHSITIRLKSGSTRERAITAGYREASFDTLVVLDSDVHIDQAFLLGVMEKLSQGADIVTTRRNHFLSSSQLSVSDLEISTGFHACGRDKVALSPIVDEVCFVDGFFNVQTVIAQHKKDYLARTVSRFSKSVRDGVGAMKSHSRKDDSEKELEKMILLKPKPRMDIREVSQVLGKPRVLLVDDEQLIRSVVARHLRNAGWEVVEASDGEMGIALMDQSIDVVFLDIMMPGIDGISAIPILKKKSESAQIVMLSSESRSPNAEAAMEKGAFEYLCKPFKPAEILKTAALALESRHSLTLEGNS